MGNLYLIYLNAFSVWIQKEKDGDKLMKDISPLGFSRHTARLRELRFTRKAAFH